MNEATIEAGLAVSFAEMTLDDILSRHRKEKKELQAKIQALKKDAPKSDKKKRKEAMEEVARLENDMEIRHAAEAKEVQQKLQDNLKNGGKNTEATSPVSDEGIELEAEEERNHTDSPPQQRVSKAQRRRDKKAREAREREEEILAAAEDAQFAAKAVEARTLKQILLERQLALYEVPSDGDCLYNAVRHQLLQTGRDAFSVQELRNETANYIRANKDALINYMTNPRTGDLLSDEEFETYYKAIRSTPVWGGQIELKALSSAFEVPIEVLQAVGPPTVQGADEFKDPRLIITYHRHLYSLGEHYNSTLPLSEVPPTAADKLEK